MRESAKASGSERSAAVPLTASVSDHPAWSRFAGKMRAAVKVLAEFFVVEVNDAAVSPGTVEKTARHAQATTTPRRSVRRRIEPWL